MFSTKREWEREKKEVLYEGEIGEANDLWEEKPNFTLVQGGSFKFIGP